MNKAATVLDRQSLFDIALGEFGSMEALFSIMTQNKGVLQSATQFPVPGTRLHTNGNVLNANLTGLYTSTGHKPVSLISYSEILGDYSDDYSDDFYI